MEPTNNTRQLRLPADVLAILRCPRCGRNLSGHGDGLVCAACAASYPLVNGVVRFAGSEDYAGSFGFQWAAHARTQLDDEENHESEMAFRSRTGLVPDDLKGKLVLDVGCGIGRFAEVASRWGAQVVGVDLSTAAEVAAQNLADRANVTIFQADVFSLPFAPASFDYIYSIGVLHHTPNCELAFKALPRLLKPGGTIVVWLYSGYNRWYRFSDVYRRLTCRMPQRWLHALCRVAVPLYYVHKGLRRVPVIGRVCSGGLYQLLPISLHPKADARVLDTFDWYSPKYQSKHTYEEVFRWFEDCGLGTLQVLHEPISVRGCKPVAGDGTSPADEKCVESRAL